MILACGMCGGTVEIAAAGGLLAAGAFLTEICVRLWRRLCRSKRT